MLKRGFLIVTFFVEPVRLLIVQVSNVDNIYLDWFGKCR